MVDKIDEELDKEELGGATRKTQKKMARKEKNYKNLNMARHLGTIWTTIKW